MQYIPTILRRILIITLFSCIVSGMTSYEKTDLMEQTIEAIGDYMEQSPVPWSDEWKKEYIETIRKVVESHRDASYFVERLEILRKGYEPYWRSFKKTQERSLFEIHQAQIRWYTENLMGMKKVGSSNLN